MQGFQARSDGWLSASGSGDPRLVDPVSLNRVGSNDLPMDLIREKPPVVHWRIGFIQAGRRIGQEILIENPVSVIDAHDHSVNSAPRFQDRELLKEGA